MKRILKKVNQTGTMLVEAMAMLGLIAMVTPILYKKAAERTTELQDINAANQLRAMANAMDAYLKDNFAEIARGGIVTSSNCPNGAQTVDYKDFGQDPEGKHVSFPMAHLCAYLPYGFIDDNGDIQETKIFAADDGSNLAYRVVVKMEGNVDDTAQTVTGFLTAVPREPDSISSTRASRIATMVGSNGGYITPDLSSGSTGGSLVAMGAQGIWSADPSDLGLSALKENSFVVSSIQPISSQGLANEDVLHRKNEPDNDDILNTMETDLFMGFAGEHNNIRLVNQIILSPIESRMAGQPDAINRKGVPDSSQFSTYEPKKHNTLYIGQQGGAYIEGVLAAMDSLFTVGDESNALIGADGGISYYGVTSGGTDPDTGNPLPNNKGDKVFAVTSNELEYGNIVGKNGSGTSQDMLLTVSKKNNTFAYMSPSYNDGTTNPDGSAATQGEVKALYADLNKMTAGNDIFQVTNKDGEIGISATNWSANPNKFAVVIGGDTPHKAGFTEYTYNAAGVADNEGKIITDAKDWAATVYGPMFVKDMIETAKLKARDVDAAVLRAGADPASYNNAVLDEDFYSVAKKDTFIVGNVPGGFDELGAAVPNAGIGDADGTNYPKLRIVQEDSTTFVDTGATHNPNMHGIVMRHDSGVDITSGNIKSHLRGLGTIPDGGKIAQYKEFSNPIDATIRIASDGEVALSAYNIDTAGSTWDFGPVSINEYMLRANTIQDNGKSYDTIDSVVNNFNIVRDLNAHPDVIDYWQRSTSTRDSNLLLGDMGLSIQSIRKTLSDDAGNTSESIEDDPKVTVEVVPYYGEGVTTSRFTGGFAIYDHDDKYSSKIIAQGDKNDLPAVYVNRGTFEIRATEDNKGDGTATNNNRNYIDAEDIIFQVDNIADEKVIPDDDERGSVYVRKGGINIAPSKVPDETRSRLTNAQILNTYEAEVEPSGYVSAERFISHVQPENDILNASAHASGTGYGTREFYDKFEVNPAYTSVMHDIKLTTRGGARLSDILPDFINKGIYVVDNTFKPNVAWNVDTFDPDNATEVKVGEDGVVTVSDAETSAFLGFVPTPQCPPGYSKVITINPSGWAMAQAGTPSADFKAGNVGDIRTHNDPFLFYYVDSDHNNLRENAEDADAVQPLTFQKNTWLKAMVLPRCGRFDITSKTDYCANSGDTFTGWSAIMGFIYPASYYANVLKHYGGGHTIGENSSEVYWNLFPVHYRQLEAYATVYCYFERKNWDPNTTNSFGIDGTKYIDTKYDQLNNPRHFSNKSAGTFDQEYIDRLNDPALKYNDPW